MIRARFRKCTSLGRLAISYIDIIEIWARKINTTGLAWNESVATFEHSKFANVVIYDVNRRSFWPQNFSRNVLRIQGRPLLGVVP